MPKSAPGQQKIQGLLTIPRHLDPAVGVEIVEGSQGKLHLQRVILDDENVGRGQRGGGAAGQVGCRDRCHSGTAPFVSTAPPSWRTGALAKFSLSSCPAAPPPCCPRVM